MSFQSGQSYWIFAQEVRRGNRYIHSDVAKDFLSTVLETSKARVMPVSSGSVFWRAQLGCNTEPVDQNGKKGRDEPVPFSEERMKPLQDRASEGRANPKGIPCLYLATDKETAMSEVRPWLRSRISVGQFKTVRELRLIDCSKHPSGAFAYYEGEPDDEIKERAVWADIDRAFSQPVTPSDQSADYVPTQILAELFKSNGFDGVHYKSALSKNGFNIALFDIHTAAVDDRFVCSVVEIKYSFGCPLGPIGQ